MFWVDIVDCFQHFFFFFLLAFEALDSFCMFLWCFFFPIRWSPVAGLNESIFYLITIPTIAEEWGFSLFCYPSSLSPTPPHSAAAAQVLVDSDKTNLPIQQTIVSNTLQQAWLSSPPFRSGWHLNWESGQPCCVLGVGRAEVGNRRLAF